MRGLGQEVGSEVTEAWTTWEGTKMDFDHSWENLGEIGGGRGYERWGRSIGSTGGTPAVFPRVSAIDSVLLCAPCTLSP